MTIDEQIAVMTAFKNGAKIQTKCKTVGVWVDNETPFWNFPEFEYRVTPTCEINVFLTDDSEYWFVDRNSILDSVYSGIINRLDYINVFETEAEAKKYYELEKAKLRVKKAISSANNGWKPNFCNFTELKYLICINYNGILKVGSTYVLKNLPSWLYIANKSCAKNIIREYKDDLLLILGE